MGRGASAPLPFFAVGSERTWRASSPPCPCREHARGGGCSRRQALFHFVYPEAPNPAEKVPQPLCLEFEKTGLLDGLNGCLAFLLFQSLPPLFALADLLFARGPFLFPCECHEGPLVRKRVVWGKSVAVRVDL